jgi:surfeit locus 1 family protein
VTKLGLLINMRLALFTFVFLIVFVRLGFWQLERELEKQDQLASLEKNQTFPVITLDKLMAEPPDNVAGRRIESEGQFLEDQVFLRDNVIFEGHVGFEVLRVFRTHEGLHVLTNFGFVQGGADRTNLPSIPGLTMPQTNLGSIYQGPWMSAKGRELYSGWPRVTPTQNPSENAKALNIELAPFVVRLDMEHPDALPRFWPQTMTRPEKHRAYAVQWFAMAVTLMVFFTVFTVRQNRSKQDDALNGR